MPTYYRRLSLALTFIILFSTFNFHLMTVKASCTLQGTVYIDFNLNGVRDVDESGVPGVAVTAFDSARPIATVLGSAVTDQNGDFVLDLSQIDDVVIRVEYTNLPEALVPAPSFGSVDYDAQRLSTTVLFGSCDNDVAFEGMNQILFTQDAYCAVFCETAGIELGNRVWFDQDGNGRQDPDESPMSNVVISLYMETAEEKRLVAQTTTDSRGRYYFNARTIDDYRSETGKVLDIRNVTYLDINDNGRYEEGEPRGVMPNSTYLIMIDNPINFLNEGDPLWGYYVTLPFANPDNIEDSEIRDSDGLAKNSAERVGLANTVSILVETGDLGSVDHSLDFGFVLEAQDIPPTATPIPQPTQLPTETEAPNTSQPPQTPEITQAPVMTATQESTTAPTSKPTETEFPETSLPPESTQIATQTEAVSASETPVSTATETATIVATELPPEVTEEPLPTLEQTPTEMTITPDVTASVTDIPTGTHVAPLTATLQHTIVGTKERPTLERTVIQATIPPRVTITPTDDIPTAIPSMVPTVIPTELPSPTPEYELLCHVPNGNQNAQILSLPDSGVAFHLQSHQDDFIIYTQVDYDRCLNFVVKDILEDMAELAISGAEFACEGFEDGVGVDDMCEEIFVPLDSLIQPIQFPEPIVSPDSTLIPTNTSTMSPTVEPTSSSTEMDTPTLEPSASKEPDDD